MARDAVFLYSHKTRLHHRKRTRHEMIWAPFRPIISKTNVQPFSEHVEMRCFIATSHHVPHIFIFTRVPRGTGRLFVTGKDPIVTGKHAQITGFSRLVTGKFHVQSLWSLGTAPQTTGFFPWLTGKIHVQSRWGGDPRRN